MPDKKKINLSEIKMLVMDVDGVLTDGKVIINAEAGETKCFNSLDGHGIRMWQRAGFKTAFLSGRSSAPTRIRARQLDIDYVFEDSFRKPETLNKLSEQSGLSLTQMAYIGDDIVDLPVVDAVGFGAAVNNAVDELKQYADYVTYRNGGNGAVRELIEYILKNTGRWQELAARYMPETTS